MGRRLYTPEMDDWLRANYGRGDPAARILEDFAEEFDWAPTLGGFRLHAYNLGLRIGSYGRNAPERAVRQVTWTREPEKQAWMEENCAGKSIAEVSRLFAARFGFPLSRPQVSSWRVQNGVCDRRPSTREGKPIGTVRNMKGYAFVKVAEKPERPGTKDNWRLLHVVKYEQYHNVKVPKGVAVLFANRDTTDYSPENLVAVPRGLIARINSSDSPDWNDRESLLACIAWCKLSSAVTSAEKRLPRTCEVCGKTFTPDGNSNAAVLNKRTCRACLDAGHKARGKRRALGDAVSATCEVCGARFERERTGQRRCQRCIDAHPTHSVERAKILYEKEHKSELH